MTKSYIFLEAAQDEYENALHWYAERNIKVADNFLTAIENTLELICEHPARWRNEYKNYHELGLKKFPYSIVYFLDEVTDTIVVVSVFHHKRNPQKKYRKI